ncbi:MAG: biotin synthase BioB [Leptolyngbyaceae cyanobacterium RU_5_1]|nr:biotin synthase BioB [Leptolyngbyaceae cyanobacterium RU_5_1]
MSIALPETADSAQENLHQSLQASLRERITQIYNQPLPDLLFAAQRIHREHHDPRAVQLCTLCSIKTGACPEDCAYCAQSIHNPTELEPQPLMNLDEVLSQAKAAKASGATRFCMGAAWREVKDGPQFERVLEMVRQVAALDLEVCCTLGMLKPHQAERLKAAGLTAYNHNLDTSPNYYEQIITTRTYRDRLETIRAVSAAGISVCCGGILGMGESVQDRLDLLEALCELEPTPESIPINCLMPVQGTPLQEAPPVDPIDLVRMIATTRILFPKAMVRLSAGRLSMSDELQTLCFVAGANSIFTGPKLLTTANPSHDHDEQLLKKLGMASKKL